MNFPTRFISPVIRTALCSLLLLIPCFKVAHSQTASGLRYDWKPGDEVHYDVEMESEIGDEHDKKTGTLVYKVTRKKLEGFREQDSSGSAFVIGSDGYLATCAHVVGEAKKVEVVLGGRVLSATVVEVNPVLDVALLKVDASNLTPIPLADSSKVLQGKKISAFGFPLSSVLGEKLKVTSGIVSGFVENVGGCRNLQFDAKVNPGNSGGPMVDESGNCVGIVTSKLIGIAVSEVGFAVPSSELVKLLQKHSRSPQPFVKSQIVAGTELVKMMSNSVALVKVKAEQHSKAFQIDWKGTLGSENGKGNLVVDNNGEVSNLTGDLDLPFLFGPLAKLVIEPLGGSSAPRWESLEQTELTFVTADKRRSSPSVYDRYGIPLPISPFGRFSPSGRASPYGRPGMPYSPYAPSYRPRGYRPPGYPSVPGYRGYPGSQPETKVKVNTYAAIERTIFERQTKPNGSVSLKKTFQFQTTEKEENPFLSLTSTGTIEFDPQQNMPVSAEFNGTLKINKSGKSISVPVKLTYRKVDKAVVAERNKKAAEKLRLAREEAKKRETVPNPAMVKSVLAKLKAGKGHAGSELRQIKQLAAVQELRDDVLEALNKAVSGSSFHAYDLDVVFEILRKYGYTQEDRMEFLISAVESNRKLRDYRTAEWLLKMPVKESYRSRVVKIADSMLSGDPNSSLEKNAKGLLAKWAKGDDDASLRLLANAKRKLSGEMSSYDRQRELEALLKFEFGDTARPEVVDVAKKALFTGDKRKSVKDVAAKLVMKAAKPEEQLSIFCDYLVDVDNSLGDAELKKAYGILSESKSKLAQQVLIVRLKNQNYNKLESKALIQMGASCEAMLLKAYEKLPALRKELPSILEFVGTEKSIPLMERLELDCHESYQRGKIHDRRVRMLKRLQLDQAESSTGESKAASAASKLGEMFGE